MKFKAYPIKMWLIKELSPLGWTTLISRAMPELLESNAKFSAYYVNERTSWSEMEVDIINWYLRKMYRKQLPSNILTDNVYLDVNFFSLAGISFFESNDQWKHLKNKVFSFFSSRKKLNHNRNITSYE